MTVYLHPSLPSLLFIKFSRGPFNLDLFSLLLTKSYVMLCAIWCYLYNLKNVRNAHGGVLLLVACNFTKSNTPPRAFSMFFKLYKWYQIAQRIAYELRDFNLL